MHMKMWLSSQPPHGASKFAQCCEKCMKMWLTYVARESEKKNKKKKKNSLDISSILAQNPTTNTYIRKEALKTHILKSPIKS